MDFLARTCSPTLSPRCIFGTLAAIQVLTGRTAQGSIAWALSLMFIPYLTLIPYLVFGRSTFDAYIKARRQANQEMHTAITELNWRPWVEEALAARNSSAYASASHAQAGPHAVPGKQSSAFADQRRGHLQCDLRRHPPRQNRRAVAVLHHS
jgi:hypothetical protein